jgi:hypothetical protein
LVDPSPGPDADGSQDKPWTEIINFPAGRTRESWSFTANAAKYGYARFKITAQARDINDVAGDEYWAYFSIESNDTPIVLNPLESPSTGGETLFGDSNGNFEVKGTAQISTGVSLDRVSIVWIKPDSNPKVTADRQLKYTDRTESNWDKGVSFLPNGYYQDADGNRVWEVSSFSKTNTSADKDNWTFRKTLNLFTDLNIGPGQNAFGAQIFLIRVLSRKNNRDENVGVFTGEKVWLESSLSQSERGGRGGGVAEYKNMLWRAETTT